MTEADVQALRDFAQRLIPRMLTQVCRDPRAHTYGCFDRDWWHYKIRDFPSIILQQGAYALWQAADAGIAPAEVRRLCAGACRFWNARATQWGAFEEYYPWEQGYPPLAFSTLAVARLAAAGATSIGHVQPGLKIAAKQLLGRFETKASNQQVAGLAAAAWLHRLDSSLVDGSALASLKSRTLALQTPEGWFPEYGGPDLGYLSVTIDCLWHAYDATGDDDYLASATRAMNYIAPFTEMPSRGAGMHNARNTDYVLPGGISRFIKAKDATSETAALILRRTWGNLRDTSHFAHAIDDRYWCHYAGASVMSALAELTTNPPREAPESSRIFRQVTAEHVIERALSVSVMFSRRKGGIFRAWQQDAELADYGWTIIAGQRKWVTHWWDDSWKSDVRDDAARVEGYAAPYKETKSSPARHMALRILSLLVGRRIIASLKQRMIFQGAGRDAIHCVREVRWTDGRVEVDDVFTGMPARSSLERSPRSSMRHVASADSFHHEDLSPIRGWKRDETIHREGDRCTVKTIYTLGSTQPEAANQ